MGVVASNGRKPQHEGVVRYRLGADRPVVAFTRGDAAMVYDHLRQRYPERAHERLVVWVERALSHRERTTAYQRGLLARPVVSAPGESFTAHVEGVGARTRVPYAGRGTMVIEGEVDGEKVAALLAAFEGGGSWVKAPPLTQWLP